ncbi:hypothetical protein [Streptomyces sp. B6B3]|uniref:hypothetical protein n=1 Tax=Streptomyces sp. B6B3 TaxID=3153570 RepID=UPI00325CE381
MVGVAVCATVTAVTALTALTAWGPAWGPAGAQAVPSEPDAAGAASVARQVTLPTGERVVVDEGGGVAGVISDAGSGTDRAGGQGVGVGGYDTLTRDGETEVIPQSAWGGIEDGTLDPGAFNVTSPGHDLSSSVGRDAAAETATVTVAPTDRAGEATASWYARVMDLETWERTYVEPTGPDDVTVDIELPVGEYAVYALVDRLEGGETVGYDWLLMPHVSVTGDTTLDLPAAATKEMDLTFEDEPVGWPQMTMAWEMLPPGADTGFGASLSTPGQLPGGVGTAQLGEPSEAYELSGEVYRTVDDGEREFHAADSRSEGFYTGLTLHTDWQDMARITVEAGKTLKGDRGFLLTTPSVNFSVWSEDALLPLTSEVYVRADDILWEHSFNASNDAHGAYTTGEIRHRPGEERHETFNTGVFGPVISTADDGLFRSGNTLHGAVNLLADGAGHRTWDPTGEGDALYDGAVTTLYRDGQEYATAEGPIDHVEFEVPAEEAEYRLVTSIARDTTVSTVSTEVVAEYTFASAAGPEDGPVPVPAYAVRFAPELAVDNTSPAGESVEVPVTVQGSPAGADPASLDVTVSTSLDGGATWTETPVRDGQITVDNPSAGGSVSFRAEVADQDGNTLTQTIIDAYRTR